MHVDNNKTKTNDLNTTKMYGTKPKRGAKSNRTKIETTKEKIRNSGHNF